MSVRRQAQNNDGRTLVFLMDLTGETESGLARMGGVSRATISRAINGVTRLNNDTRSAIAECLGFPPSLFSDPPEDVLDAELTYRRPARTPVSVSRHVSAEYRLLSHAVMTLSAQTNMRPRTQWMNHVGSSTSPAQAAAIARHALGIAPSGPVANIAAKIESAGIVVAPLSIFDELQGEGGDALCRPQSLFPTIGYARRPDAGDRERFTRAHELGHLVYGHGDEDDCDSRQAEQVANQFAGEFLMPASDVRQCVHLPLTLNELMRLKGTWGISMAAIVTRAKEAGVISPERAKNLFIQLSMRGWRKHEPVVVGLEKPMLLSTMLERRYGYPDTKKIDFFAAVDQLHVSYDLLRHWTADAVSPIDSEAGFYK